MKARRGPAPKLRRIPLKDLVPRKGHAYKMLPYVRGSLVARIAETHLYPPLIVRPLPRSRKFEILDGHRRSEILAELGHPSARCEVWELDELESAIAAATLNALRSRADAKLLGRQIRGLIRKLGSAKTGEILALSPAAIRQRLIALSPPREAPANAKHVDLQAVTFHLPRSDAELLGKALQSTAKGSQNRSQRLMGLIKAGLGKSTYPPGARKCQI